jgi:hypothetical protein
MIEEPVILDEVQAAPGAGAYPASRSWRGLRLHAQPWPLARGAGGINGQDSRGLMRRVGFPMLARSVRFNDGFGGARAFLLHV